MKTHQTQPLRRAHREVKSDQSKLYRAFLSIQATGALSKTNPRRNSCRAMVHPFLHRHRTSSKITEEYFIQSPLLLSERLALPPREYQSATLQFALKSTADVDPLTSMLRLIRAKLLESCRHWSQYHRARFPSQSSSLLGYTDLSPPSAYTKALDSPTFEFLTYISISTLFSIPELVKLSSVKNLGILEIIQIIRDKHQSSITDRLIRAWYHSEFGTSASTGTTPSRRTSPYNHQSNQKSVIMALLKRTLELIGDEDQFIDLKPKDKQMHGAGTDHKITKPAAEVKVPAFEATPTCPSNPTSYYHYSNFDGLLGTPSVGYFNRDDEDPYSVASAGHRRVPPPDGFVVPAGANCRGGPAIGSSVRHAENQRANPAGHNPHPFGDPRVAPRDRRVAPPIGPTPAGDRPVPSAGSRAPPVGGRSGLYTAFNIPRGGGLLRPPTRRNTPPFGDRRGAPLCDGYSTSTVEAIKYARNFCLTIFSRLQARLIQTTAEAEPAKKSSDTVPVVKNAPKLAPAPKASIIRFIHGLICPR
ncbi:hypothetical protein VTL71DRAFT_7506 [Oculimacula yallundae]|uniref:Uncharacterized protein n=1 Tax=Oculimacula yallundae TaxID=86028 RepID=A0ABR4BUE1_9HELO